MKANTHPHKYADKLRQKYSHFFLVKTQSVLKVRLICHSVTSCGHRDNKHPAVCFIFIFLMLCRLGEGQSRRTYTHKNQAIKKVREQEERKKRVNSEMDGERNADLNEKEKEIEK